MKRLEEYVDIWELEFKEFKKKKKSIHNQSIALQP